MCSFAMSFPRQEKQFQIPNPTCISRRRRRRILVPPSSSSTRTTGSFTYPSNKLLIRARRHHSLLSAVGNDDDGARDTSSSSHPNHASSSSSSSDEDQTGAAAAAAAAAEKELEKAAAIEAVSEILQERGGLSAEESFEIASKSPNYLQMLIDSVRDLEWTSITTGTNSTTTDLDEAAAPPPPLPLSLSFKSKVYEMALQKDEKGMVPFLEYLGLTLPFAMYLARSSYLSSQTLPLLLPKVKYVKEIFFSGSDDETFIGQKARRMMMHLSIPVDEDVQHTLSFFQKIQARRGGLDLLGSGDVSFRYLIESFPRLLSLSVESHVKPMVKFLEDSGVPKGCMRSVLLLFPSVVFYDIEKDVKPRLQAFKKVNAGDKELGKMLLKYPWILSTSIQKNYMEVLSLFHMKKVPEDSIQRAIKSWPLLLGCSISKLTLMVERFQDFGVNNKRLGQVIATSPQLLMQKPQEFQQVISFLKDLGLDDGTVGGVLGRCPNMFSASIERTLKKKVAFLTDRDVSRNLPRAIRKYPELLLLDVDKVLLPRVQYLMKMGLSKRNVAFMVDRFSPLLGYSIEEVLRPKLVFLVKTMGKPLGEVVEYPRYFSYSLEKKIKPRYWVLKSRDVECNLKEMLGKNDEEFAAEYF